MTNENGGNNIEQLRERYKKQLEEARKEAQNYQAMVMRLEGALLALEELEKENEE